MTRSDEPGSLKGTTASRNIEFVTVPKSCNNGSLWDSLIQKSKSFRLESLRESPEAFASTYEAEVLFEENIWIGRLENPQATTIVALDRNSDNKDHDDTAVVQRLVLDEWLATTVLTDMGELSKSTLDATKPPSAVAASTKSEPHPSADTLLFKLNGVYVTPAHRDRGVGQAMIRQSLVEGRDIARSKGYGHALFRVRADADNSAARATYEKAGFPVSAYEKLVIPPRMKDGLMLPAKDATVLIMDCSVAV